MHRATSPSRSREVSLAGLALVLAGAALGSCEGGAKPRPTVSVATAQVGDGSGEGGAVLANSATFWDYPAQRKDLRTQLDDGIRG